jgi:hypothetical protein
MKAIQAVAVVAACSADESPEVLPCAPAMFDSAGTEYSTISGSDHCFPSIRDGVPAGLEPDGWCPPPNDAGAYFGWGRFFWTCPACNHGTDFSLCRPLVCEADIDCPRFPNSTFEEVFECRNGLCQSADLQAHPVVVLYPDEALLMCQADLERGEPYTGPSPCPGQGETCPLPLPDVCLQP